MSASSAIFTDSSYQWSEIRETTADFVLPDITNGQSSYQITKESSQL